MAAAPARRRSRSARAARRAAGARRPRRPAAARTGSTAPARPTSTARGRPPGAVVRGARRPACFRCCAASSPSSFSRSASRIEGAEQLRVVDAGDRHRAAGGRPSSSGRRLRRGSDSSPPRSGRPRPGAARRALGRRGPPQAVDEQDDHCRRGRDRAEDARRRRSRGHRRRVGTTSTGVRARHSTR